MTAALVTKVTQDTPVVAPPPSYNVSSRERRCGHGFQSSWGSGHCLCFLTLPPPQSVCSNAGQCLCGICICSNATARIGTYCEECKVRCVEVGVGRVGSGVFGASGNGVFCNRVHTVKHPCGRDPIYLFLVNSTVILTFLRVCVCVCMCVHVCVLCMCVCVCCVLCVPLWQTCTGACSNILSCVECHITGTCGTRCANITYVQNRTSVPGYDGTMGRRGGAWLL